MQGLRDARETAASAEVAAAGLPFEPLPAFAGEMREEAALAQNQGKRIGILIVTYNALTTLTKVLKRITPEVWKNMEEIAVFDDASQDSTIKLPGDRAGFGRIDIPSGSHHPKCARLEKPAPAELEERIESTPSRIRNPRAEYAGGRVGFVREAQGVILVQAATPVASR